MSEMTMYADYLKERENKHLIVKPYGFAVYGSQTLDDENVLYVQDVYVKPEYRHSKLAAQLTQDCIDEASAYIPGLATVYTSIDLNTANEPEPCMKACIDFGFKISHLSGSMIYLKKEIKD